MAERRIEIDRRRFVTGAAQAGLGIALSGGVAGGREELPRAKRPEAQWNSSSVVRLDGEWLLAPDPENIGRAQGWWSRPQAGARPTPVPWIIQEVFPDY